MEEGKRRLHLLDSLRGTALVSMIAYHAVWDLVFLYDVSLDWYRGMPGYVWQQSICWCFILLSGFCWKLGRRQLRRGLTVFGAGWLVTAVTLLVMPENRVIFGVLVLLGACSLLLIPLEKWLRRVPAMAGAVGSILFFVLFRDVNSGFLGFEGCRLIALPEAWYHGYLATWLGFPDRNFYSTDYFSLLPWGFLFLTGYFLYRLAEEKQWLDYAFWTKKEPRPLGGVLAWLGRHSLLLYLLHQPVLYLLLQILMTKS